MVSVIIPTYNRGRYICECIDSVLHQSYKDIEIIVVDDGSSDNTKELLNTRYENEKRLIYIYQDNQERSVARNRGIAESNGEFIAFLDSDDVWLPFKLEKQLRLIESDKKLLMVVTWWDMFDDDHNHFTPIELPTIQDITSGHFDTLMLIANRIGSPTPLIRKEVIRDINLFSDIIPFEDWEFWTRLSIKGTVGLVPEILASHRIHPGNTERELTAADYLKVIKKIRSNIPHEIWKSYIRDVRKSFLARLHNECPKHYFHNIINLVKSYIYF